MIGLSLFPVFMVGMLGSVHCVGMCGGIVGALSVVPDRKFPVTVAVVPRPAASGALVSVLRVVTYNFGRIAQLHGGRRNGRRIGTWRWDFGGRF